MPKMLGIFGHDSGSSGKLSLLETINPLNSFYTKCVDLNEGLMAVSSLLNSPLKGERIFEQENDIICFSGDLAGFPSIPWEKILNIMEEKKYGEFKEFHGNFAVARFNKKEKKVTLVSDRRSQQPVYYKIFENGFAFSTELSSFCRLSESAIFNEKWLYDYLFFNYPLFQTTFLKNVYKMPAASVFSYNIEKSKEFWLTYAESFQRKTDLIGSPESFKLAADVFRKRVPQYFEGSDEIACALTGGWDGRTMVSLCPEEKNITTYTYGVPGCSDLIGGEITAKKAGLEHLKICFDDHFVKRLPEYMLKTVFLSSGSEKILRSTLLYVYENFTNFSRDYPLTISGIALDGVFRGHSCVPPIVSYDVASIFRKGKTDLNHEFWGSVFNNEYREFSDHIGFRIDELRAKFGEFKSPEHHLLYKLYVTHPELFGGELKIAENFTTVRVPSWDAHILDLAFSIKESGLSFSEFTQHQRGNRSEIKLQAYLLNEFSKSLSKIPIRNTRPDIAIRNKLVYETYRICQGVFKRIKLGGIKFEPLENWDLWLNGIHKNVVDEWIFSNNSLIKEYISDEFLKHQKQKRDIHWIGKLVTTELILRLMKNRWN
jgi:asparagine synthetase B (glutamine-hydrolysing)